MEAVSDPESPFSLMDQTPDDFRGERQFPDLDAKGLQRILNGTGDGGR